MKIGLQHFIRGTLRLCVAVAFLSGFAGAQRLAVVVPEKNPEAIQYAARTSDALRGKVKVLDPALAETAFESLKLETPFNITAEDARRAAAVVGCDFLLLIRTGATRRESFEKGSYYEAFAVMYLVSGRTGKLVDWELKSFEESSPAKAAAKLQDFAGGAADRISTSIKAARNDELSSTTASPIEELPEENSPESKNFRTPVPYKRIKPAYTQSAFLYDVRATVDIEVDIDASGKVLRTNVVRWAGFGLDESADAAVRQMNWRPAERNGRTLPMRVLLRYNFIKVEKE